MAITAIHHTDPAGPIAPESCRCNPRRDLIDNGVCVQCGHALDAQLDTDESTDELIASAA